MRTELFEPDRQDFESVEKQHGRLPDDATTNAEAADRFRFAQLNKIVRLASQQAWAATRMAMAGMGWASLSFPVTEPAFSSCLKSGAGRDLERPGGDHRFRMRLGPKEAEPRRRSPRGATVITRSPRLAIRNRRPSRRAGPRARAGAIRATASPTSRRRALRSRGRRRRPPRVRPRSAIARTEPARAAGISGAARAHAQHRPEGRAFHRLPGFQVSVSRFKISIHDETIRDRLGMPRGRSAAGVRLRARLDAVVPRVAVRAPHAGWVRGAAPGLRAIRDRVLVVFKFSSRRPPRPPPPSTFASGPRSRPPSAD